MQVRCFLKQRDPQVPDYILASIIHYVKFIYQRK